MDADLDLLLTTVFVTADDLLPERRKNAARRVTDAEVVTHEHGQAPHLAPIRQRIESIFWTCKDLLTLERHGARTLAGLREGVLARFCCLAAAVSLNHQLGRPSRALVNYCA